MERKYGMDIVSLLFLPFALFHTRRFACPHGEQNFSIRYVPHVGRQVPQAAQAYSLVEQVFYYFLSNSI